MKKVTWSVVAALVLGGAGCQWKPMPLTRVSDDKTPAAGAPAAPTTPAPAPAATRPPEGPTPVEQALELSQKLKQVSEDLAIARKENKDLVERNAALTTQAAKSTMEMNQAHKELEEANAMLREMQTELINWKKDVLGYRDEMRAAQTAQLDALRRVLKLLGAEEIPLAPSTPTAAAKPAAPTPGAPAPAPASQQAGPAAPTTASAPVGQAPAGQAPTAPAGEPK